MKAPWTGRYIIEPLGVHSHHLGVMHLQGAVSFPGGHLGKLWLLSSKNALGLTLRIPDPLHFYEGQFYLLHVTLMFGGWR